MTRNYSLSALRAIGEQCSGKLPPASAMQAMFLYELQRATEAEKLFQGQMFELARVQDASNEQETRVAELERSVARLGLTTKGTIKDHEERLNASNTHVEQVSTSVSQLASTLSEHAVTIGALKAQQWATPPPTSGLALQERTALEAKIEKTYRAVLHATLELAALDTLVKEHASQLAVLAESVKRMASTLDETKKIGEAAAKQLEDVTKQQIAAQQNATKAANLATTATKNAAETLKQCIANTTNHSTLQAKVESCDKDIGLLFDERDALASLLKQAMDRIEKQDGLIRALTLQASATSLSGTSSPTSTQVLPVMTNDGHPLNLRVPKGKPLPHQNGGRSGSGSGSSDSL